MATYKVLQDIEAEDKLVGPLTLRQFIYAGITAICGYLCFILLTNKLYFGIPIFLFPGMLTGFFAFPWGRDQPTEIWALAKIRFMLKPRRRIWDQSGVKELVTITAPKRIEVNYTNGLSQTEVKSRLQALADTIDTRGWAVKNVTSNIYALPRAAAQDSDRLVEVGELPAVSPLDARNTADIMDDRTSPVAQNFDRMMEKSDEAHRQQIVNSMSQANTAPQPTAKAMANSNTPSQWFISNSPIASTTAPTQITAADDMGRPGIQTDEDEAEQELAEQLRQRNKSQAGAHTHTHTILPLSEQKALGNRALPSPTPQAVQAPMTRQPDPAIIALANNNDLNVATIARQAKRDNPPDEVVISLH